MKRRGGIAVVLFLLLASCAPEDGTTGAPPPPETSWADLRARMVEEIGAGPEGVRDADVLRALSEVERHLFVPESSRRAAYQLKPLQIEEQQAISDPYLVGLMTALLELTGEEKVLEIGTGSGYQAAVLARLVPEVHTMEIRETLAESARKRLASLGFDNVVVHCGDGYEGLPAEAPFDAIIVTAAPPRIPRALVEQLAPGGRMVLPVGPRGENQDLVLLRKDAEGNVTKEKGPPVNLIPMIRK